MLDLDTTLDAKIPRKAHAGTLGYETDSRLSRLLSALKQGELLRNALSVTEALTRSWRDQSVANGPAWPSDITDDHSPFEFSLALNGQSEVLRILTEPQDALQPSLVNSWRLAAEVNEELVRRWGASLGSFQKVSELFEPGAGDEALFSAWHSAILSHAQGVAFKVYLNPVIHGADNAASVVAEAMRRLGLEDAWRTLCRTALLRPGQDEVIYFSLDLADAADARVKIYVAHRHADTADVARSLSGSAGFSPADVGRWCEQLLGTRGPYLQRPPISCFAFRRGQLDLFTTTLHLPVRCYSPDDFDVARRISTLLRFPQRVRYMRAVTELAERPLENGAGLQTYASLRASPGREAVTVYLAPQLYSSAAMHDAESVESFFSRHLPVQASQSCSA